MYSPDKITEYFYILKKRNIIGTSYLFIGKDFSPLKDVIKLVACPDSDNFCNHCWDCRRIEEENHPDLFLIKPDPLTVKIEAVREAQKFLSLKSFRLKRKIVILKEAQTLSDPASNAFLKTLEEPPQDSFIAVCTSKLEGILPTMISRCRKIFLPFKEEETEDASALAKIENFLKGGRVEFKDRRAFSSFLYMIILLLRDRLVSRLSHGNNRLLEDKDCEIILRPYPIEQLENILKSTLEIYSVYNTVNQNLALNLIKNQMSSGF